MKAIHSIRLTVDISLSTDTRQGITGLTQQGLREHLCHCLEDYITRRVGPQVADGYVGGADGCILDSDARASWRVEYPEPAPDQT